MAIGEARGGFVDECAAIPGAVHTLRARVSRLRSPLVVALDCPIPATNRLHSFKSMKPGSQTRRSKVEKGADLRHRQTTRRWQKMNRNYWCFRLLQNNTQPPITHFFLNLIGEDTNNSMSIHSGTDPRIADVDAEAGPYASITMRRCTNPGRKGPNLTLTSFIAGDAIMCEQVGRYTDRRL